MRYRAMLSVAACGLAASLICASDGGRRESTCLQAAPLRARLGASMARSLEHDGRQRLYYVYVPRSLDESTPAPLVFVLHGGGGTAAAMRRSLTARGFERLADRDGFIVIYPQGVERHWNDGRGAQGRSVANREQVDDVGFLVAIIERLAQQHNVDRQRICATGISNGGLMSFRLAGERADLFTAIAPVTASISRPLFAHYAPSQPVSVLVMNGTEDPLVPYEGGTISLPLGRSRGEVLPTSASIEFWVAHDRCYAQPVVTMLPDRSPDDGTRVRRSLYRGGKQGTEVVFYAVIGGGHTWPGGPQYLPQRTIGRVCHDIDANEVIWDFFKRHPRQ